MTTLRVLLVLAILLGAVEASAQDHEGHGMAGAMSLFPTREVSGTAWQPDLTPMYGFHGDVGGWTFMVHAHPRGNAAIRMTNPTEADSHDRKPHQQDDRGQWDWITVAIALLGITIVLVATSEIWMWHPWR